jgi:hypothetical protein
MDEKTVLAQKNFIYFRKISDFVKDLNEIFKEKSFALYSRLLSKMSINDDEPIQKHFNAFRALCIANRDAILEKNSELVIEPVIKYSQNIYIDMGFVFRKIDDENRDNVWNHLIVLSTLLDPKSKVNLNKVTNKESSSETKEEISAIPELTNNPNFSRDENDLIAKILGKVEKHIDPNGKPEDAMSNILNSGILPDLIETIGSELNSGKIDLMKMMGSMSGMMNQMGGEGFGGGSAEGSGAIDMSAIGNMLGGLGLGSMGGGSGGGGLDLSSMMGMLGGMGGGSGGGIEEQIAAEMEKMKNQQNMKKKAEEELD